MFIVIVGNYYLGNNCLTASKKEAKRFKARIEAKMAAWKMKVGGPVLMGIFKEGEDE